MLFQTIKTISNFLQIAISSFGKSPKTCFWQVIIKIVESCNFEELVIEFVNNFLIMSSINMLNDFLLILHAMLSSFSERLALEVNINCLIEVYKLNVALQNSFTSFVAHIRDRYLYVTNLEQFCLVHVISKEESQYCLQEFKA